MRGWMMLAFDRWRGEGKKDDEVGVAINLYFLQIGVDRGINRLGKCARLFPDQNKPGKFRPLIGSKSLDRTSEIPMGVHPFVVLKEAPPTTPIPLHPRIFIDTINATTLYHSKVFHFSANILSK